MMQQSEESAPATTAQPIRQRPITSQEYYARQAFLREFQSVPGMAERIAAKLDSDPEARDLFVAASQFFFNQGVEAASQSGFSPAPADLKPALNGQHDNGRIPSTIFEKPADAPAAPRKKPAPVKKEEADKPAAAEAQRAAPAAAQATVVKDDRKRPADPGEGTNKRKVLDFIRSRKDGRATAVEVGEFCEKQKPSIPSHHANLSQMVESGHLIRVENGVYADPFHPAQKDAGAK